MHIEAIDLLNVRQAADFITMSQSFVYKLSASGEIPVQHIGRSVRFRRSDLLLWLEAHRHAGNLNQVE